MKPLKLLQLTALLAAAMLLPGACAPAGGAVSPSAGLSPAAFDAAPAPTPLRTPIPTTQPDAPASASAAAPEAATPTAAAPASGTPAAAAPSPIATGAPLSGLVIGIDPGHQARANSEPEPVAPGSDTAKKKVSSGTQGRFTGVAEYKVNLEVGLRLKKLLTGLGAAVVMTRETHDVDISNKQRAQMLNEANADLVVRIHCNGTDDPSVHGAFVLIPSNSCTAAINDASKKAGRCIIDAFCDATGAKNLGLQPRSDQTGFNWSAVPVCNIEMGHMTNEKEDNALVSDDYQSLCAQGIANGIVDYFS